MEKHNNYEISIKAEIFDIKGTIKTGIFDIKETINIEELHKKYSEYIPVLVARHSVCIQLTKPINLYQITEENKKKLDKAWVDFFCHLTIMIEMQCIHKTGESVGAYIKDNKIINTETLNIYFKTFLYLFDEELNDEQKDTIKMLIEESSYNPYDFSDMVHILILNRI